MKYVKTISNREFELEVTGVPVVSGMGDINAHYSLRMRLLGGAVDLWGDFRSTKYGIKWPELAALSLRHIVKSQNCELPRLQMYEVYLLNLWARELDAQ